MVANALLSEGVMISSHRNFFIPHAHKHMLWPVKKIIFLLETNVIIYLGVVTVSEEVEIHGGDIKTLGGGF